MKTHFRVGTILSAVLILAATAASGQISCGAVVTSDKVMTADLVCSGHNPAFTVQGPATVNMDGHTVTGCPADGTGIAVVGSKGGLKNGAVIGCDQGVRIAGSGGHTVENVVVHDGGDYGFLVESANNTVIRTATFGSLGYWVNANGNKVQRNIAVATGWGFLVTGDDGKVVGNIAAHVSNDGFAVFGSGNLLSSNKAHDCYVGFWVEGGENRLAGNVATASRDDGFFIYDHEAAAGSRVERNIAVAGLKRGFELVRGTYAFGNIAAGNDGDGLNTQEEGNRLRKNKASANGSGIAVDGPATTVDKNLALANLQGIAVNTSAADVSVVDNIAVGSSQDDLFDASPQCAGHVWSNNVFATGDPFCTD